LDGATGSDPRSFITIVAIDERTIAELQKEKGYRDPAGLIIVRNEKNETILSVPFLPACA